MRRSPGALVLPRAAWLLLGAAAFAGATAFLAADHARSWHYFADAGELLFADTSTAGSGLDLYRLRPDLQFGPLMAVVAAGLGLLPPGVEAWAVIGLGGVAGVLVLALVADAVRHVRPEPPRHVSPRVLLACVVPFELLWLRLAAYTAHLDDVVALTSLAAAIAAIGRRRHGCAAAFLAVAAAAKPWAAILAPLALVGDGRRLLRLVVVGAVPVATWLPFLLGSPGTLDALRSFALTIDPNSGLRVLGVDNATAPGWVRPTQLLLGFAVVSVVVLRERRWTAALAAGLAVRLLLDPATNHYYTVGLALGGLAWELSRHPDRLPWRTAAAVAVLELASQDVTLAGGVAVARVAVLSAIVVDALFGSWAAPAGDSAAAGASIEDAAPSPEAARPVTEHTHR